ncbi:hypothetical protein AOXY_G24294 [Acipenser oxyrinchus oxyrinchus]|uniref:IQCH-like ATP-grasp domain-containing protein n=1 Tax=Acipenser oxyrinchus oxyrinchus TaxID=40147 RepID=A0AAD8G005_ACIOX|nr:hypothetical protein AOXY_G24294 [Acipenser oxyrinchus oxyrinchus]
MADIIRKKDDLGNIIIKVQEDLCHLKENISRITIERSGEVIDIQALETAIQRTENGLRKHAEEYLNTVNNQILTLPSIDENAGRTDQPGKWKPKSEAVCDRWPLVAAAHLSPGEQHKHATNMKIMYDASNPSNRALLNEKYGVQMPRLNRRKEEPAQLQKISRGPTVGNLSVVPAAFRNNPYLVPPVPENEGKKGMASLLERGLVPSAAHISIVPPPVRLRAMPLHSRDEKHATAPTGGISGNLAGVHLYLSSSAEPNSIDPILISTRLAQKGIHAPPPSVVSKKSASKHRRPPIQPNTELVPYNPQPPPVTPSLHGPDYCFTLCDGLIDYRAPDLLAFKQHYCLSWGGILSLLESLTELLKEYAVPVAIVHGQRLAELAMGSELDIPPAPEYLVSVLENYVDVWELMHRPGQRYKGVGGVGMAAVTIQSSWRRHRVRAAYLEYRRQKWAAGAIAISWLLHAQMVRMKKALKGSHQRHLENFRSRAKHLAANWNHIRTSRRTIIHIPSLGYSQPLRFSVNDLDIQQNLQMGRLCDIQDPSVDVIYVCPVKQSVEVQQYYSRLLGLHKVVDSGLLEDAADMQDRFKILTPEAMESFQTHNMCLSTLLKYSPQTIKRIKNLIKGKHAYVVGGVLHKDDLAVADLLNVPILGSEPEVAHLYSTKSGNKRIFASAGVPTPPGEYDIYNLQQMHEVVSQLIIDNLNIRRWLLKMDSEFGGRGTAHFDVSHMKCYSWMLKEYRRYGPEEWRKKWAQEPALLKILEELPEYLSQHGKLVNKKRFPSWKKFLETFLSQGGVVEACPPSESITNLTVDMLIEPNGEMSMVSCGDQIHAGTPLECCGTSVPQSSVDPDILHSTCMRITAACKSRGVMGYLSIDLVTFIHPHTLEQQVWATDLDLCYSDQLSMTQLMLLMTRGRLDCRSSQLEVPAPARDVKQPRRLGEEAATPPTVTSHYAVMSTQLRHTNLARVHYSVFFQMCKAQGVGFDIKERQGTLFILHDSHKRQSLGMITIGEDLQGALMTFARNLSIIHQEISAPNMQGETNFKGIINDIEGILGVTIENQARSAEEGLHEFTKKKKKIV